MSQKILLLAVLFALCLSVCAPAQAQTDPMPPSRPSAAPNLFLDVSQYHWAVAWINQLYHEGVTGGCGTNPLVYCPDTVVTRAQMAVFLVRVIHGAGFTPPAAADIFGDVPSDYWANPWINQLYADGVTGGCSTDPLLFCPDLGISRGQMAVFLLRAVHGNTYVPPASDAIFEDVPAGYWSRNWIGALYDEGYTGGCSTIPLNFCPEDFVNRAQMAVFLLRAIHGPTYTPPADDLPALGCSDDAPALITTFDIFQPPPLPEPAARLPFRDPVFGTCLVRVTDRAADPAEGDTSAGLKNEYSRVQAFNADESLLLVRGIEATWYVYDARSLQPLGLLPFGGSVDPRWSADDPNVIYYSEETRLMSYDLASGATGTVHEFANDFPGQSLAVVWSKYEGSPSRDGRYWGFMAEDQDWNTVAFLVYDQQADKVIAIRDVRGVTGIESVDNAYISPLGNYFIADFSDYFCERGVLGTDARPCGYMVYDRDLQNGRGLLRISGHQDLALDANGREVVVFQDIDTDNISMLDLETGAVTPLWPIDFSHTSIGLHISGRAFDRPGWALVSTHDGDPASYTWMDDSVFAVELKPNGRVVRLAHTQSLVDESMEHDYWAEPQATVNRDFTRILFTTNWGRSGTGEVEMFMIQLDPGWFESLP